MTLSEDERKQYPILVDLETNDTASIAGMTYEKARKLQYDMNKLILAHAFEDHNSRYMTSFVSLDYDSDDQMASFKYKDINTYHYDMDYDNICPYFDNEADAKAVYTTEGISTPIRLRIGAQNVIMGSTFNDIRLYFRLGLERVLSAKSLEEQSHYEILAKAATCVKNINYTLNGQAGAGIQVGINGILPEEVEKLNEVLNVLNCPYDEKCGKDKYWWRAEHRGKAVDMLAEIVIPIFERDTGYRIIYLYE